MKKFISALTSLAIATTALGGTIVLSADAADKTIIEFQSKGKNTIEAKAGDTVPVTVYVPQCTGANVLSLKMSINGSDTLGVGVDETADELAKIKAEAEKTKDEQAKKDYLAVEHWLYGNYGIKTANEQFATPYCFDSGIYQEGLGGGDYELAMSYFLKNSWNISLTLSTFVSKNANADAYAPWVAAGEPDEYDDYTPVTTWTKDDSWAYDYALATFDLVLPEDLKDGTYTLDVLKDKYINVVSHQWAKSSVSGKDGSVEFDTVPLKIVVGDGKGEETTTTPAETTAAETTAAETTQAPTETTKAATNGTSANVDKPAPKEGTVQYDLIADGLDCGFDGKNNTVTVEPGAEIKVQWVVKNDPGTAGMQMHFDFSDFTFSKRTAGKAYKAAVQWNDQTYAYVWASDKTLTAADDAVVSTFTLKAPTTEGTYILGTKTTDGPNIVRPLEDSASDIPFTFYGLAVTVGTPGGDNTDVTKEETQAPTTETTAQVTQGETNVDKPAPKEGTVQYDLLADGMDNGFDGKNNTVKVAPGSTLKVNWVVKNDPGTAGMQMHFDFSDLTFTKRTAGKAYKAAVQWNDQTFAYVWASDKTLTAADDAVVSSFTFTVPEEKGTYILGTKTTDGPNIVRPLEDSASDIPFTFYGLAVTVGDIDETTGTTEAETTVTTTETTAEVTEDTQKTETTQTTAEEIGTVKYGDVNVDGEVRINDVVMFNRYLASTITVSAQGLKNADCNKDGKQEADDVTLIMKYLAKLIDTPEAQ